MNLVEVSSETRKAREKDGTGIGTANIGDENSCRTDTLQISLARKGLANLLTANCLSIPAKDTSVAA